MSIQQKKHGKDPWPVRAWWECVEDKFKVTVVRWQLSKQIWLRIETPPPEEVCNPVS